MTIIKIGGKVFKGLKWTKDQEGTYHSGPFHIFKVPYREGVSSNPYCDIFIDNQRM